MIIALIVVQWAYFARWRRGAALVERGKEYVEAARCMSLAGGACCSAMCCPTACRPLIVIATIDLAHAIALEATLSFLGVGVPVSEPLAGHADLQRFRVPAVRAVLDFLLPGIALALAIIAINLVGDHLRDVLNPRNADQGKAMQENLVDKSPAASDPCSTCVA